MRPPHYLRFARAVALVSGLTGPVVVTSCSGQVAQEPGDAGTDTGDPCGPNGSECPPGIPFPPDAPYNGYDTGTVAIVDSGIQADDGGYDALEPYDGRVVGVVVNLDAGDGGGPRGTPELPASWS